MIDTARGSSCRTARGTEASRQAAMAMHVMVAHGTVVSLSPLALSGGSFAESRRVLAAVAGCGVTRGDLHGSLQHVAAESRAGLSTRRQSRGIRTRAEQTGGGDGSAATTVIDGALVQVEGGITEVDKDTFWPLVKSAGEKVVVLDMYTQWCGPCKLMLPKLQALAATMDDVIFCKLDCNQDNKPLAKELGIKVVPTFKIFKSDTLVGSVSGAKYDDLVKAIESARSGQ